MSELKKKLDRIERMVEAQVRADVRIDSIDAESAVRLLRAEQARVRRVIRAYKNSIYPPKDDYDAGKLLGCDHLLNALKEQP